MDSSEWVRGVSMYISGFAYVPLPPPAFDDLRVLFKVDIL